MNKGKLKFVKSVIFVTAVLYLLFVFFTIIFSGSWHALSHDAVNSFFLEYVIMAGAIIFCSGLAVFFLNFEVLSVMLMGISLIIILLGFYFYWKDPGGLVGACAILTLLIVQIWVTKKLC